MLCVLRCFSFLRTSFSLLSHFHLYVWICATDSSTLSSTRHSSFTRHHRRFPFDSHSAYEVRVRTHEQQTFSSPNHQQQWRLDGIEKTIFSCSRAASASQMKYFSASLLNDENERRRKIMSINIVRRLSNIK